MLIASRGGEGCGKSSTLKAIPQLKPGLFQTEMDGLKGRPLRENEAAREGVLCVALRQGLRWDLPRPPDRRASLARGFRPQACDGKMAVLVAEDVILTLSGAVDPMQTVRLVEHQLGGDILREKYLTGVRGVPRFVPTNLKMAAYPHFEWMWLVRPM